MKSFYSTAALAALLLAGLGQAKADILCPNQAKQGGIGSNSFTPVAGDNDGVCGTNSGVTLSLTNDQDYAKLMWNTATSPSGASTQLLPSGLTLGTLPTVTANVDFSADSSGLSPYFVLSLRDPTNVIGGHPAGDQILMLEFEDLGFTGPGTMTLNGNTVFNFFDNTSNTYLPGGQQDKASLSTWLSATPGLSNVSVDGIWIAEGLAGGCAPGGCAESVTVTSAELVSPTPEPATIALFFGGFAGVVALRRRFAR